MRILLITTLLLLTTNLVFAKYESYTDKRNRLGFTESYRTMNDGHIQRQSDLASIPQKLENEDYKIYLEDVKNGAEVKPFDYEAEDKRQKIEQNKIKAEQEKIKKDKEKEAIIEKKIKDLAIEELKKEGKLDINEELVND